MPTHDNNSTTASIPARDGGRFGAYLAVPAPGAGPGLALIHEIFGLNQHMRDVADWYQRPVAGAETARKVLDPGAEPSNVLIDRADKPEG